MEEDSASQSLEESIKRVVCIEDAKVETTVASSEVTKCCDGENITGDIVKVDVVKDVVSVSTTVIEDGADSEKPEVSPGEAEDPAAVTAAAEENDPESEDSEDDLQLIVNDEDIFYPHGGAEGVEEPEGEEMFAVAGEEHYEELDWAAEMHYHHSQFFKYVRPGSGPATVSPGVQDPAQQTPGSAGPPATFTPGYGMGLWNYPFEAAYEFVLPASKTIFDIDVEQFEDKPWEYPGVDISDYFNFGFTEETWKQYCEDFARVREEVSRNREDEYGQGWNYDNGGYNESSEPHKGRGRRNNFSGRAVQVEGGAGDRRSSGDLRRQRRGSVVQIPSREGRSQGRHENNGEYRRQRNDDLSRRRGFTEQSTPLGGRLSRAPSGPSVSQNPGDMFSSPSRRREMYTPRSRISSPGRMQSSSRRHSSEYSSKPWRSSADEDEGSYGSSGQSESGESDRYESEEEYYSRSHRLKRFSSQPLESRLGARAEVSPRETEPEKRSIKLSRHVREEEKEKVSEPATSRRFSQRTERSSASAQVVTLKRSSEVVTERRSSQAVKKTDHAVRETVSTQVTEVKTTTVERKVTPAVSGRRLQPAAEPEAEKIQPVAEKKMQSISERRAQLVAEKRAEKLRAEKRERLAAAEAKADNRERVDPRGAEKMAEQRGEREKRAEQRDRLSGAERKVEQRERVSAAERKVEPRERAFAAERKVEPRERAFAAEKKVEPRERASAAEKKVEPRERASAAEKKLEPRERRPPAERNERLLDTADQRERLSTSGSRSVRGKEQTSSAVPERRLPRPATRTRTEQPKQDNGDLRLKVLERVSARWKFHLRLDDEHAKKKRENLNRPVRRKEEGSLDANGDSTYEMDAEKSPEKADEQIDDRRRKIRREYDEEDSYEDPAEYDVAADERWEMDAADKYRKRKRRERNEYEDWDEGNEAQQYGRLSSSRRGYEDEYPVAEEGWEMEEGECEDDLNPASEEERWNVNEYEEEHDQKRKRRRYNYEEEAEDMEEARRDQFYEGSTSSGQGDEVYFKGRGGKSFRRESDRWTGTLYDSGDEYDQ